MTLPLRLVVFDCDGTLVDSQHTIVESMDAAFHAHGLAPPAPEAVRRVVGLTLAEAIARLTPELTAADHAALTEGYKAAFVALHARDDHHEPLYPGTREVLDVLDATGLLMGVATGKGRPGLLATLERHGLVERFVTLQTSDRARGKPHREMLLRAMEETGVEPARTVMVGDTVFDVEMAVNAGVAAVGVSWGYHGADELAQAGAAVVIDRFAALAAVVDDLTRQGG